MNETRPESETPTLAVDARSCIGCGACVLLAPQLFRISDGRSRPGRPPADGDELGAATASVLVCPTQAIKVRGLAISSPASPGNQPGDALYPQLAAVSEAVRWGLEAVDWDRLDPARTTPALRTLVREMAFSEHATYSATQRFMQMFGEDIDFTQWLSVWFYEETRHPHLLGEWLRRLDQGVDQAFVLRGRVSTPFMRSRTGTLTTNIISEVTAAAAYQSLGRFSGEPALAQIATFIAGDEARHAASFWRFARARIESAADPERERLDAVKVLHFWLNETDQVSHPINQMLERWKAEPQRGQDALEFDFPSVRRRVTRLIGLLVDRPLRAPDEVLPLLKQMTADQHARQRQGQPSEPPSPEWR